MCDFSLVTVAIAGGTAGIVATIVLIGVAAVLNNSFFAAGGSPYVMLAAGIAAGAAATAFGLAIPAIDSYVSCMGLPEACAGNVSNLKNALAALATTMGVVSGSCFSAAAVAWIPWAGAAPMYAILGAIIPVVSVSSSLAVFLADVISCLDNVPVDPPVGPVVAVSIGVAALTIGLTAYIRRDAVPASKAIAAAKEARRRKTTKR